MTSFNGNDGPKIHLIYDIYVTHPNGHRERLSPDHWTAVEVEAEKIEGTVQSTGSKKIKFVPPMNAEYLLFLALPKKDSEAIAGDLEERWRKIRKKFGVRKANFWYWFQVIRSLWPFGVAAVKRVSGLLALVAVWKKLKS